MVKPSAMPRGMIVTLCTGSECGSMAATRACPASWYAVFFFSSSESRSDLRSTPMRTLSFATSKSYISTALRFWRAAAKAASLTMFARSAPEKPGVPRASTNRSTSSARGILRVHTRKIPLADDVDLFVLARGTPGFSGADLANMVNEAALAAARQNRKAVLMYDFEVAKDKVLMGVERKSLLLSDEEKKNTAYHEAGHALVAAMLPHSDPVHKVTIIPRGMALGLTMQLPTDDRHNYYKNYLDTQIAILMGGRIAEELFLNSMSTGAGNDIERATEMARKMVCEWSRIDRGPLSCWKKDEQIFLGREISQHRDYIK